jgi:exopolyphosphatase/guanosine-5'-triphosphate,3'-diphosphate pyrophosphatase
VLILEDRDLPFRKKERLIIGLIARYHGRDLPEPDHEAYSALSGRDQGRVRSLAALLRIADALDVSHEGRISGVQAGFTDDAVVISCTGNVPAEEEQSAVAEKGNLFEQTFKKRVEIAWIPEP